MQYDGDEDKKGFVKTLKHDDWMGSKTIGMGAGARNIGSCVVLWTRFGVVTQVFVYSSIM